MPYALVFEGGCAIEEFERRGYTSFCRNRPVGSPLQTLLWTTRRMRIGHTHNLNEKVVGCRGFASGHTFPTLRSIRGACGC
jgi:hypothetical protein